MGIRFKKDNFVIAIIQPDREQSESKNIESDEVVVLGDMLDPTIGVQYTFEGKWVNDPKWGKQYKFSSYHSELPSSLRAIKLYIRENCKGIGPVIAKKIVDKFGSSSLKILKEEPERVASEVQGLTPGDAVEVSKRLISIEASEKIVIALKDILSGTGVNKTQFAMILSTHRNKAIDKINKDPFGLTKIRGIGFKTADRVAAKVGHKPDSEERIRQGICHILNEKANGRGHVCYPKNDLIEKVSTLLNLECSIIKKNIEEQLLGKISCKIKRYINMEDGTEYIYLSELYYYEDLIAKNLVGLLNYEKILANPSKELCFDGLEDDQKEALKLACENPIVLISGAPGVGKSFAVKAVLDSFPGARIALAAPTGKAAKRLEEVCKKPAQTIHRLLGTTWQGFSHHRENPLKHHIIVLDELSMIDVKLMASLLDAVNVGTRLIMIGDPNQLPSVGPGMVLSDMINCGLIPHYELTKIKRQADGDIVNACHKIKEGVCPEINPVTNDLFFFKRKSEQEIVLMIKDLVDKKVIEKFECKHEDIQVISPTNKQTKMSVNNLNPLLQEVCNPVSSHKKIERSKFRIGDRVIQKKNDYSLDIYNGDVGVIVGYDVGKREINVKFENPSRIVGIPKSGNNLKLAYAITCHSGQGAEFPVVIIPLHTSLPPILMDRNWVYTAISRAKRVCILVGDYQVLRKAVARGDKMQRWSNLSTMLRFDYGLRGHVLPDTF